jgi:hypothetical protein
MNTRIVHRSIPVVVCALLSATSGAQTPPTPQVSLVALPAPSGGSNVYLSDVDAAGNVLGGARIGSGNEVVEWVGGKTPVVFPRLAADQNVADTNYSAIAVNKSGAVLGSRGSSQPGKFSSAGIYWDASRHPTAIANSAEVTSLSDTGAIVGTTGGADVTAQTAARWASPTSQPSLLPYTTVLDCADPDAGECYSLATTISPNGKYIFAYASQHNFRARWGSIYVDGVIASNFNGSRNTYASQITDSEVVIGNRDTGIPSQLTLNDVNQAYRWEAGTFTDLGALPGAAAGTAFESSATSMNSSGVIVGYSEHPGDQNTHAVMWINDEIIDLHAALAAQLPANTGSTTALALNDSGEFIVTAQDNDTGAVKFYLAKPLIPTHTTITSNINPSTYGQQIHLVAKVSPDSGPVPTTGSVSWYDNGTLLGTARLTAIGTSSWAPSTWTGGVHNVTAVFPASATLASSTSPVFKQTVNPAATRTTVSAAPSPAIHGQPVKLTATVVPISGTIAGTVTFKSGTPVLGTGVLDARTKQTWLTTAFAKAGSYSITASFAGSQNFAASASSAVTLIVK